MRREMRRAASVTGGTVGVGRTLCRQGARAVAVDGGLMAVVAVTVVVAAVVTPHLVEDGPQHADVSLPQEVASPPGLRLARLAELRDEEHPVEPGTHHLRAGDRHAR